jgi:hypothetical protein
MTPEEHKLMVAMFMKMYERFGILADTLKSRGIWSGDDPQAFAHAVHFDREKMTKFALQAFDDYFLTAEQVGVEVE